MVDAIEADFEAFFRREYAAQVRVAYVILGDDGLAREIAQEAFARALQRWARLASYERPGAWVRLVCVRLALRTRDKRSVEVSQDLRAPAAIDESLRDLDLSRALLSLPRSCWPDVREAGAPLPRALPLRSGVAKPFLLRSSRSPLKRRASTPPRPSPRRTARRVR